MSQIISQKKSLKVKHVPMRTCIVTHKKLSKSELIRLVKLEDNGVEIDLRGKLKGRGANISPDLAVFDQAIKRGVIERALKLEKKFSNEETESLRNKFRNALEERSFRPDNKPVVIRIDKKALEKVVK